jgi:aspartate carbamoyltransferase catalytic subunit
MIKKGMQHFIDVKDISRAELDHLFELANEVEAHPKEFNKRLEGKLVSTLFFEPSTRTRLSFESAILKLGGSLLSTENAGTSSSSRKSESLEDTIKVIAGYCDCIVIRHSDNDSAIRAASASTVPIINAGSGSAAHPSQSLLDAYTIQKKFGELDNLSIAFIGDLKYGRTANSLIKLLSHYKSIKVYLLNAPSMELGADVYEFMKIKGISFVNCTSFADIPSDVNVLYQTRVQKERMDASVAESFKEHTFTITNAVVERFSDTTIVLHPLPRVDEIAVEVDNDKRAMYFEQAHNGVPVRMAILLTLLDK